jgi:hypothetical protein
MAWGLFADAAIFLPDTIYGTSEELTAVYLRVLCGESLDKFSPQRTQRYTEVY